MIRSAALIVFPLIVTPLITNPSIAPAAISPAVMAPAEIAPEPTWYATQAVPFHWFSSRSLPGVVLNHRSPTAFAVGVEDWMKTVFPLVPGGTVMEWNSAEPSRLTDQPVELCTKLGL